MSSDLEAIKAAGRFDLHGRVALVTGGSRGLGRAMILGLAAAGADVIIASRKLAACEEVAQIVKDETGREALPYGCHVGNWDDIDGLVEASYDRFGKVDILVNNAGMSPVYDKLVDVTESLWDKVFAVNVRGPFRLSALVGTRMAEGNGGSIINISTGGAIHPTPDIVPYAAAKAGLNAMTIALAHAFGPKVRVNCVMPGPFRTDIAKTWTDEFSAEHASTLALKRLAEPDEIVGTALYLASDASTFTTGAMITVDGGHAA